MRRCQIRFSRYAWTYGRTAVDKNNWIFLLGGEFDEFIVNEFVKFENNLQPNWLDTIKTYSELRERFNRTILRVELTPDYGLRAD